MEMFHAKKRRIVWEEHPELRTDNPQLKSKNGESSDSESGSESGAESDGASSSAEGKVPTATEEGKKSRKRRRKERAYTQEYMKATIAELQKLTKITKVAKGPNGKADPLNRFEYSQYLSISRYLQLRLDGKGRMEASEAVARIVWDKPGKSSYKSSCVRDWANYYMKHKKLKEHRQGKHPKTPTIIHDPAARERLLSFLRSLHEELCSPQYVMQTLNAGLLTTFQNAPPSISEETARRWMLLLGFRPRRRTQGHSNANTNTNTIGATGQGHGDGSSNTASALSGSRAKKSFARTPTDATGLVAIGAANMSSDFAPSSSSSSSYAVTGSPSLAQLPIDSSINHAESMGMGMNMGMGMGSIADDAGMRTAGMQVGSESGSDSGSGLTDRSAAKFTADTLAALGVPPSRSTTDQFRKV